MPTTEFGQMLSASLADVDLSNPINYSHPLAKGLVGFWLPLPSLSGGTKLYDLCRRLNLLSHSGNPLPFSVDVLGTTLDFSGTTDYCYAASPISSSSYTISIAFKPAFFANNGIATTAGYSTSYNDTTPMWLVRTDGTSILEYSAGSSPQYLTLSSYQLDQWYHVTSVRYGSVRLAFLDGVLAGVGTNSGGRNAYLLVGTGYPTYWSGKIAYISVHLTALSEDGVRLLHREWLNRFPTLLNRRRFWYPKSISRYEYYRSHLTLHGINV